MRALNYLLSKCSCRSLPFTVSDLNWPSSSTSTLSCPFSKILQDKNTMSHFRAQQAVSNTHQTLGLDNKL